MHVVGVCVVCLASLGGQPAVVLLRPNWCSAVVLMHMAINIRCWLACLYRTCTFRTHKPILEAHYYGYT